MPVPGGGGAGFASPGINFFEVDGAVVIGPGRPPGPGAISLITLGPLASGKLFQVGVGVGVETFVGLILIGPGRPPPLLTDEGVDVPRFLIIRPGVGVGVLTCILMILIGAGVGVWLLPILIGVGPGPVPRPLSILMGVDVGAVAAPMILLGACVGVGVATTAFLIFRPGDGVGLGVGVGALCKAHTARRLRATDKGNKFSFITIQAPSSMSSLGANEMTWESFKFSCESR